MAIHLIMVTQHPLEVIINHSLWMTRAVAGLVIIIFISSIANITLFIFLSFRNGELIIFLSFQPEFSDWGQYLVVLLPPSLARSLGDENLYYF